MLLKCDLPHDSTVTTAIIASPSGLDGLFFEDESPVQLRNNQENISWLSGSTWCSLPLASFSYLALLISAVK